MPTLAVVQAHLDALASCRRCPRMEGTPVHGRPVLRAPILLVGQAPGAREAPAGRPFAHTAGRTLFRWLESSLGLPEEEVRERIWLSAVCRCFPGKNARGGDRVPGEEEIARCAPWLEAELAMHRPALVLAVGKLAIARFLSFERLEEVVGEVHRGERAGVRFDVLPLPHPSGASTWHVRAPGKELLARALERLARHEAARRLRASD